MLPLFLFSGSIFVLGQNIQIFNTTNSGIPENTIRAITFDNSGKKIIATDYGLSIFDDFTFQNINSTNSDISDNAIRSVIVDQSENIWIGTTFAGAYKFDGTSWTNFAPENCNIPDHFIRTINQDITGNMWFGTVEGLAKFDGTNWTTWTLSNSDINSNNIASILVKPNNDKIIGTLNGGIIYYDGITMTEYTLLEGGIPDNSVTDIAIDDLGNLWFATPSSGFYMDNGTQNWQVFSMSTTTIPTNGLTSICYNPSNGNVYGGSLETGLIRFNPANGIISNFNSDNSLLPDNHITCLKTDASGALWIGTAGGGLVKWQDPDAGITGIIHSSSISPNPFEEFIHVKMNDPVEIKLSDLIGNSVEFEIICEAGSSTIIPNPNLPFGVYILSVAFPDGRMIIERIIKEK